MHIAYSSEGCSTQSHVGSTMSSGFEPSLSSVSSPDLSSASGRRPLGPLSTISRPSSLGSSLMSDARPQDLGSDYSLVARSLLSGISSLPSLLSSDGDVGRGPRRWFPGFYASIPYRVFNVLVAG